MWCRATENHSSWQKPTSSADQLTQSLKHLSNIMIDRSRVSFLSELINVCAAQMVSNNPAESCQTRQLCRLLTPSDNVDVIWPALQHLEESDSWWLLLKRLVVVQLCSDQDLNGDGCQVWHHCSRRCFSISKRETAGYFTETSEHFSAVFQWPDDSSSL